MPDKNYIITEITVKADFKSWGQRFNSSDGSSSGSDFTWTVKPKEGEGFSELEAKILTLELRKKLHALLTLDSEIRKTIIPHEGEITLDSYNLILSKMNEKESKDESS